MKVLWVKFGWSEYYRGGPIDGNFGWLREQKGTKKEGRGHEAFNFMPASDGTYYCYVPPQGSGFTPWNEDNEGWTVICLAKNPKYTGVHIVGWYENATLIGDWLKPPSDLLTPNGAKPDMSYCIRSKSAFFVPPQERSLPFSDPSVRQGKYSFLEGPEVADRTGKKRVLAILQVRLKSLRPRAIHNPTEINAPDPELDVADPLTGFGTPEHRKKVEEAAEQVVTTYYTSKGYKCENMTKVVCGHDFVFRKGKTRLHVEVKGTSSDVPGFFLTRNEHKAGYEEDPAWRLAMVTRALTDQPKVEIFDAPQLRRAFDLTPYVFLGRPVPRPANA